MSARGSTHRVCCLDGNRLLPNQIPTYIAVKIKELFIGGKRQKRNKKECVGRGCWAVASSGGLVPRGPGPGPRCRFSSFSWGEGGGRPVGGGGMSCAAPGPALALDATVSYCCWGVTVAG